MKRYIMINKNKMKAWLNNHGVMITAASLEIWKSYSYLSMAMKRGTIPVDVFNKLHDVYGLQKHDVIPSKQGKIISDSRKFDDISININIKENMAVCSYSVGGEMKDVEFTCLENRDDHHVYTTVNLLVNTILSNRKKV